MHRARARLQLFMMRTVGVSRKRLVQADRIFLLDFCGHPRNGSLYRRLQAYSLPSLNTRCRPLFRHEHCYHRVRPRIPSRFAGERGREDAPEVSRGVRLIFCHFAASRSLVAGSKTRDESGSAAARPHPFKLWSRRQFRLFRNPLSRDGATGQLSGAICNPTFAV